MRKLLSLTFLLALSLLTVMAQQKTDFSGTWKLNVAKSDFGPLPPPTSRTDVITHKDPSLTNNITIETPEGKQQATANYSTDGKESVNKMGDRDVKATVKWAGSNLAVSSKFSFNDTEVTGEATWSLSADGKTLTITGHYTSSLGEADQKLIFEKQ